MPVFNENGLLPPGDYELTFSELRNSKLVKGPNQSSNNTNWDKEWRLQLVNNCELLVNELRQIGITEIFINGSFVEDKYHPNDIDGYFECDFSRFVSGEIQQELNKINPHKVWTWDPNDRRSYRNYVKKQLPMWHFYRVEFYPHYGNFSGITDQHGNQMQFPAAFRCDRATGKLKGIVKLIE